MMILVEKDDSVLIYSSKLILGEYDEPGVLKWAGFDENDQFQNWYFLDNNYDALTIDDTKLPADFESGKYLYVNDCFIKNPNWKEAPKPIEKRLDDVESESSTMKQELTDLQANFDDTTAELLFEISMLELS